MANRHFDLNQNKSSADKVSSNPKQMDFNDFLFHLPEVEFIEAKDENSSHSLIPSVAFNENFIYEEDSSPTKRYFGYSFVIHAMLASAVLFLTVPLIKDTPKEIITIEIKDTQGFSSKEPVAAALLPVATPKMAVATVPKNTPAPKKVVAVPPKKIVVATPKSEELDQDGPIIKLKPISTRKSKAAQMPKVAALTSKSSFQPAFKNLVQESNVVVPESLDDIMSEDLDSAAITAAVAKTSNKDLNKDLESDLSKVDQNSRSQIEEEAQNLGALAKNVEAETDENLKSVEDENKAQMAAALEANKERRNQEAQAIAAAQAQEEAEMAAAAAQAREAAEAAAAARAKEAAEGNGSVTDTSAGTPGVGNVRSLQEMRQMPGNPKPYYDNEERLRGDAGDIVFLAYVTRDGRTTNFKLAKGTGHRNLDLKTLKALKKWKFYPGQEGWVEFPFQWNLNGGVKEMPALLRRSR